MEQEEKTSVVKKGGKNRQKSAKRGKGHRGSIIGGKRTKVIERQREERPPKGPQGNYSHP